MTKDAAIELAEAGVRVNSIHPAYIDTQMADYGAEAQGASKAELEAMHPIGHMGEPDDMAYAALYLASEESAFVTGTELVLDGGFTAQ
jgi:NAD(P)-dependent dehydrogenase (short-subunit alcohol dehydrogenase family)